MEDAARERQKTLAALRVVANHPKQASTDVTNEEQPVEEALTLEEEAEAILEASLSTQENAGSLPQPISLTELAPRRANWDLKRDLQRKLEVLEEQTQAAILELVQQRIRSQPEAD